MNTCKQCIFYEESTDDAGICKRYPPQMIMVPQQNALGQLQMIPASSQPGVEYNRSACGEFETEQPELELVE